MKAITPLYVSGILISLFLACCQRPSSADPPSAKVPQGIVGGPFENSEYGLVGMPEIIMPTDTSPGWEQTGQRLEISGIIYQLDGKTPVAGATLYYYHTDIEGHYSAGPNLPAAATRHGYIRGWVKSDEQGRYTIFTVRPGAYPGMEEPAHIHLSVYEPGIANPYYLDELVFDDDPLLTAEKRSKLTNRGGSGVLALRKQEQLYAARHDIILGLNIPNYP